jgi:outer membrane protein TolC
MGAPWTAGLVVSALLACGCASRPGAARTAPAEQRVGAEVARRAGLDPAGADVAAILAAPLTEASSVKVALLQNPEVRATYERLGVARAELVEAGLLANPVFALESKGFAAGPEVELSLAASFVDLLLRPLRRRVAAAELRAEEAAVARDLVRLVYDVRRAVVRVLAADAVVALAAQALERAEASRDLMQKLHAAGNALDTVRTVEEAAAARARLDLDAARLSAAEAREPLLVLLGLGGDAPSVTLAGSLPEPPAAPAREGLALRAERASLDLTESRAHLDAAACRAGLARREGRWPGGEVGVVGKREADGEWGFGPAFALALPMFDWGQGRTLAAHAELRREAAEHEALGVRIHSAARLLSARHAALRARLAYQRDVYLPLRERLVREGLQFFNAMQIGAFEVLHAKRQELDARREHAETLRETWLALLDLNELLAGSLNPDRLDAPDLPDAAEEPEAPRGH